MRPQGTAQELEARRHRAVALLEDGRPRAEVADVVGATPTSVSRWWKAYREGGEAALRAKPPPGRPCKLSAAQKLQLRQRLLEGARASGFGTDLWTCPRIRELIRRLCGVTYHVDTLPRSLRAMGFSCQRPHKRAFERDGEEVAQWVACQWPRIKRGQRGWGHTWFSSTRRAF